MRKNCLHQSFIHFHVHGPKRANSSSKLIQTAAIAICIRYCGQVDVNRDQCLRSECETWTIRVPFPWSCNQIWTVKQVTKSNVLAARKRVHTNLPMRCEHSQPARGYHSHDNNTLSRDGRCSVRKRTSFIDCWISVRPYPRTLICHLHSASTLWRTPSYFDILTLCTILVQPLFALSPVLNSLWLTFHNCILCAHWARGWEY